MKIGASRWSNRDSQVQAVPQEGKKLTLHNVLKIDRTDILGIQSVLHLDLKKQETQSTGSGTLTLIFP